MIAVIPAKLKSTRVPNKNWRPFYKNKSLTDLKIEQLLNCLPAESIYLSCDDVSKIEIAKKYGINFLLRDSTLAIDDCPWHKVVTGIVNQLPVTGETEVLWVEATSPLFSNYQDFINTWQSVKDKHDSIAAVNELREFLLNKHGKAVNFEFGKGHRPSQELEPLYSLDSFYIMRKQDMISLDYMIGNRPHLYVLNEKSIEIDTMEEFQLAQQIYQLKKDNGV